MCARHGKRYGEPMAKAIETHGKGYSKSMARHWHSHGHCHCHGLNTPQVGMHRWVANARDADGCMQGAPR